MQPAWRDLDVLAKSRLPLLLSEALGIAASRVRLTRGRTALADFAVTADGRSLLVKVVGPSLASLLRSWSELRADVKRSQVPVLVVPFMTPSARALCEEHSINWLDLSGNSRLSAPGLHVRVDGQPNAFARPGRPPSVFERRSSRLARVLLLDPSRTWTVRACAKESGLNEGHVSRIVGRLVADGLLARKGKELSVPDPLVLLEAWRAAANFSKHRVLRGHVAARSGEELLAALSKRLREARIGYAATGLGAAWLYDHFAMFRLTTFYVREWPSPPQLEQLRFREEPQGANAWLVLPADDGVFDGARLIEGVECVHPVQAYVDLKDQPERAAEATEHLRQSALLFGGARARA